MHIYSYLSICICTSVHEYRVYARVRTHKNIKLESKINTHLLKQIHRAMATWELWLLHPYVPACVHMCTPEYTCMRATCVLLRINIHIERHNPGKFALLPIHTHTHTHTHFYMFVYACVSTCILSYR